MKTSYKLKIDYIKKIVIIINEELYKIVNDENRELFTNTYNILNTLSNLSDTLYTLPTHIDSLIFNIYDQINLLINDTRYKKDNTIRLINLWFNIINKLTEMNNIIHTRLEKNFNQIIN